MNTKPILRIYSLFYFLILPACASYPEFVVSDIELLDEKTAISFQRSEIEATGFIRATIIAEIDLIQRGAEDDINVWYEVSGCTTGAELEKWPYLYPVENNKSEFSYQVFFSYKNFGDSSGHYNLAANPEDLCFVVGMGDVGFIGSKPSPFKLKLTEKFLSELKKYNDRNGLVDLTLSENCMARMCVPDYAK